VPSHVTQTRLLPMFNVEQKRRRISNRSTAVPMDFEFTHRVSSNTKPVWAAGDPFHTPQKRTTPPLPTQIHLNTPRYRQLR